MNLHIELKKGLSDIRFGYTPETIQNMIGLPSDTDELENANNDDTVECIVWYYPEQGLNFFFDIQDGNPVLYGIEIENNDAMLFGIKVFECNKDQIVKLMNENGYRDIDEDDEPWGDHRITFDDAQADFYFENGKLILVSWSNM